MTRAAIKGGALSIFLATAILTVRPHAQSYQTLPYPWKNTDVGSPALRGFTQADAKNFTVLGAGTDIGGTSDQFHFVYQAVSGDVEIVARLAALQGTNALAKGGLMIRESLAASARHAFAFGSLANGWGFLRRWSIGSASYLSAGPSGRAPAWIKLAREGNLFTAFHSTDGLTWRVLDSETITMPQAVYVGFAVTSRDPRAHANAFFDSFALRKPASANQPPSIAMASPAGGASFALGQSIPIEASASDPDGTITRVDLYRGGTLVKSDTTRPFTTTWTPTVAGTYTFSATAFDDDGQISTARPVSITVSTAPTALRATLKFTASADHNTNVSAYAIAIYRSVDSTTAVPVASKALGKPTPVSGVISVDLSSVVSALPAGSYKAVVTATGPGGSTPSSPSPAFSF